MQPVVESLEHHKQQSTLQRVLVALVAVGVALGAGVIATIVVLDVMRSSTQTVRPDDDVVFLVNGSDATRALVSDTDSVLVHGRFDNGTFGPPLLDALGRLQVDSSVTVSLTENVISTESGSLPQRHQVTYQVWPADSSVIGDSDTFATYGASTCELKMGVPADTAFIFLWTQANSSSDWYSSSIDMTILATESRDPRRTFAVMWPLFRLSLNVSATFSKAVWVSCVNA